jgi:flagellar biosynthesis protein FlhA
VDTLGLEVGYRLIALVDKARQGDLLARIKGVRKKFAQEVGFLPPPVHIRDNLDLKPSIYRVTLRGAVVGEGEAFPGMHLAINPGGAVRSSCPARRPPIRPSACPRCGSTSATARQPK